MILEEAIAKYAGQPIPRQVILSLLKEYNRPNDKIHQLIASNVLIPLRRGLYIFNTDSYPEKMLIANHLMGPSYVSMDYALSYYGLIPEKVYTLSSMTVKGSKVFETPIGRFSFTHLPLPYYSYGMVQQQIDNSNVALMASQEKALCDLILATSDVVLRSVKGTFTYLFDDLRLDEQRLKELHIETIRSWLLKAPKRNSLQILIKTLEQL